MPPNSKIHWLLAFLILASFSNCRRLIQIHELFRHGARYPLHSKVNDKSDYAAKDQLQGELTYQGKHMQYILGKIIYDKYWKQLFEGTPYIEKYHPSQFYIKSTNVNRTIESVQAQLLGLLQKLPPAVLPVDQLPNSLPPYDGAAKYQPKVGNQTQFEIYGGANADFHAIPIHEDKPASFSSEDYIYSANPYDEGDFLIKYSEANCPNQKFWAKENMAGKEAMKIKSSKEVTSFLEKLSNAVGAKVKYEEAYVYVDDYQCNKYMGREYLDFFNDQNNLKTANFIMTTSTIFTYFHNQDQIKTSNTRLLQNIVSNMKQAIIGKGPRVVLFSAHDTTLMSLWAALKWISIECLMKYFYEGVDNADTCIQKNPAFASNVIFELWEEDNLSHSISIFYNGKIRKIPVCGQKTTCRFTDFQSWVNQFAISDPNDVCGIQEHYLKLYIIIFVLSVIAIVLIIVYLQSKWRKKLQAHMQQMEEKKGYIQNFEEKEGHKQPEANTAD